MNHSNTSFSDLKEQSFLIGYQQHFSFLLQTIEFILSKLSEVCKWQNEQDGIKKKKQTIKFFDKNIDSLSNFKVDQIQLPHFDEFPKIIDKVQLHKNCLPKDPIDGRIINKIEQSLENEVSQLSLDLQRLQLRTKSLQTDTMDLIIMYRDIL